MVFQFFVFCMFFAILGVEAIFCHLLEETGIPVPSGGVGIGPVIATVISWSLNKSIWFAFVHGFFGWFYVLYFGLGYGQ